MLIYFFFFKQKTAYEMRISDWSSDVCSSDLLGVSGRSRDMRDLLERERDDPRARLAVEIFCYRARKYIGAYLAALGGADAVVFSGGIAENSPEEIGRASWRERGCQYA